MKKVGVVLSGCGFKDGAEIQESVLTLLHLDNAGVEYLCIAPNINQTSTVNHLTGEKTSETRNVLVESARIARGNIKDIKTIDPKSLDAVIFPGGFGAATNLSNFASEGENCEVNHEVEVLIKTMRELKKPLGFICIAPTLAAKVLGSSVKLTIGSDEGVAKKLDLLGAVHENRGPEDITIDLENKVVSTPAYMCNTSPKHISKGIEKLVKKVLELI